MKKLKVIGNILMLFALFFVVRRLLKIDWTGVISEKNLPKFILYIAIYTLIVLISYLPWRILVGVFTGKGRSLRAYDPDFCYVFTKANILKYVPGNIFQYVGRNEIASILGLDHANVAMAAVSEIVLMAAAACLCSFLLIGSYTTQYLKAHIRSILFLVLIVLVIAGGLLFYLYRRKKEALMAHCRNYKEIILNRRAASDLLLCFVIYFSIFICIGLLFAAVINLCGDAAIPPSGYGMVVGGFILSWLAGYITPGAPGGIGVRELIMTVVFAENGYVSADTIVTASALYRVINTFGDVLGFLIMLGLRRLREKNRRKTDEVPGES